MAAAVALGLLAGACSDDDADPVEAAQERVADAEAALGEARAGYDEAAGQFCADSESYIVAIDRYGGVFDDSAATVGDVTTAGADLAEPREAVTSSAEDVVAARDEVVEAEQELIDAQAELQEAQTGTTATPPESPTTTTLPASTVNRVEQAEADLERVSEGITDETPLTEATAEFNSAAFALQVAWLRLFADAGCLTDEQQAEALTAVTDYTVALQTALQAAGYLDPEVPPDGIYGPATVAAVEQLQEDRGLPVTGFVDRATAEALEEAVLGVGGDLETLALVYTTSVQQTLTLAGYWTGPVDGVWTPELTEALMEFQIALGVEPTGEVDAATLAAFDEALAELQSPTTTTTTTTTPDDGDETDGDGDTDGTDESTTTTSS